jgi:hypothetical protein
MEIIQFDGLLKGNANLDYYVNFNNSIEDVDYIGEVWGYIKYNNLEWELTSSYKLRDNKWVLERGALYPHRKNSESTMVLPRILDNSDPGVIVFECIDMLKKHWTLRRKQSLTRKFLNTRIEDAEATIIRMSKMLREEQKNLDTWKKIEYGQNFDIAEGS